MESNYPDYRWCFLGFMVLHSHGLRQVVVGQNETGFAPYQDTLPVPVHNKKPAYDWCSRQGGRAYSEYNLDYRTDSGQYFLQMQLGRGLG